MEDSRRNERPRTTRLARFRGFQEKHPNLYASRHVAVNVGGTLLAILGVSALLRTLLPKLDLPSIDLNPPDWLRYLDPWRYLKPLFEWVPDLDLPHAPWAKVVVGFVVACIIATAEAKRRKKLSAEQQQGSADE